MGAGSRRTTNPGVLLRVVRPIRLMGEHTVDLPPWSVDGLMFNDSDELVREFGVREPDHDAAAAAVVRRLNEELAYRYSFVYKP